MNDIQNTTFLSKYLPFIGRPKIWIIVVKLIIGSSLMLLVYIFRVGSFEGYWTTRCIPNSISAASLIMGVIEETDVERE